MIHGRRPQPLSSAKTLTSDGHIIDNCNPLPDYPVEPMQSWKHRLIVT